MNEQFEKFLENIKLTAAQREDAQIKYSGVCKKLHDHYYPDSEYDGTTKLLIGSYGKHTHIRPANDIDVIFMLPEDKYQQYDDNRSNKQSQLLNDVKNILEEKYPDTPISAFGKIVKLEFAEGNHNVEVLPAWESNNGTFILANSENGGSWERQDYRQEIKDINDSDAKTRKTKSLIRMVKKWKQNCTAVVSSFAIEKKVLEFFANGGDSAVNYGELIKNFFEYFHDTTTEADLKSHLVTAYNRSVKALEYESDVDMPNAADEWKKIFGDDFPAAATKSLFQTIKSWMTSLQQFYPSLKEEFLETKYGIPTRLDPTHEAKVNVRVDQDGFRPFTLYKQFKMSGYRIYKHAQLEFTLVKNTVRPPYDIKWKVRNFGEEAKNLGALRGEIYDDDGRGSRLEKTLYHGEHCVECYIIKDGVCVAQDTVMVPIQ